MTRLLHNASMLAVQIVICTNASAGVLKSTWDYLKDYRLGIDLSRLDSSTTLEFDTPEGSADGCDEEGAAAGLLRCAVTVEDDSSKGYEYGLFIQQAFKRKGLLHWAFDLGLAVKYLSGEFKEGSIEAGYGLNSFQYQLVVAEVRPYVQLGLTPKEYLPDLIFTLGMVGQSFWGHLEVNDVKQNAGAGILARGRVGSIRYTEIELVLVRFGRDGAFSLFTGEVTLANDVETKRLFPEEAGTLTNIDGRFRRQTSGIKLVIGKL